MLRDLLSLRSLALLDRDGRYLFAARMARMFSYGLISVILAVYLAELGFSSARIGLLLTLTLVGDTAISLGITTTADRVGRRRMLTAGALLMIGAGTVFGLSAHYWVLVVAATVGVISPSGNEVGPFLAIEQSSLAQMLPGEARAGVFAWYNLCGSLATALGALIGGSTVGALQNSGWTALSSFRVVVFGYAALGAALIGLFALVSSRVEAAPSRMGGTAPVFLGLHKSKGIVFQLSSLFAMDAFAGGFIVQSIAVYWFHARYGTPPATLGAIFFGANLLAGVSALAAAALARRIGLLETMVFTHIPSNVLLILVPLMPNQALAIAVLLLRFSISQMDVPTRQAYTVALVDPDERSAAAGVTGVARTAGAAISPSLAGLFLATPALMGAPFFIAGGLKIAYDVLIYWRFRRVGKSGNLSPL